MAEENKRWLLPVVDDATVFKVIILITAATVLVTRL